MWVFRSIYYESPKVWKSETPFGVAFQPLLHHSVALTCNTDLISITSYAIEYKKNESWYI